MVTVYHLLLFFAGANLIVLLGKPLPRSVRKSSVNSTNSSSSVSSGYDDAAGAQQANDPAEVTVLGSAKLCAETVSPSVMLIRCLLINQAFLVVFSATQENEQKSLCFKQMCPNFLKNVQICVVENRNLYTFSVQG